MTQFKFDSIKILSRLHRIQSDVKHFKKTMHDFLPTVISWLMYQQLGATHTNTNAMCWNVLECAMMLQGEIYNHTIICRIMNQQRRRSNDYLCICFYLSYFAYYGCWEKKYQPQTLSYQILYIEETLSTVDSLVKNHALSETNKLFKFKMYELYSPYDCEMMIKCLNLIFKTIRMCKQNSAMLDYGNEFIWIWYFN